MRFPRWPDVRWLAVAAASVLAGCVDRSPAPQGRLTEAIYGEPASFDPRAQVDAETYNIMYAIYNTLVELDDSMRVKPALAERWETRDYRTWRITLRPDAYFHEDSAFAAPERTRRVTAADVVYSLNRALAPGGVGAFVLTDIVRGAAEVNEGKVAQASGLRSVDARTVEVELIKPYRKLPERLATPFLFIVPREAVEKYGESFGRHPVGTGAFEFEVIVPGQAVRLTRNDRFWGVDSAGTRLPYLAGIDYRIFRDPQLALAEFTAGHLDAVDVPPVLAPQVVTAGGLRDAYRRFTLLNVVALDVHYFGFRMDRAPFAGNPTLRQALNYAIDKDQIARNLLNGLAEPAVGVLPPGVFPDTRRTVVYPRDSARVAALLSQAGFPGGRGLPPLRLNIDDKATTGAVAEYVQSAMARFGVRVELRRSDFNTLLANVGKGDADFFYMYWEGTDPNAEIFMVQFRSELVPESGGYNFGRYRNAAADSLFEAAVGELDARRSEATWLRMNEVVVDDAPWMFLYHTRRLRLLQPGIEGYDNNPLQIRRFVRTRKTPS